MKEKLITIEVQFRNFLYKLDLIIGFGVFALITYSVNSLFSFLGGLI